MYKATQNCKIRICVFITRKVTDIYTHTHITYIVYYIQYKYVLVQCTLLNDVYILYIRDIYDKGTLKMNISWVFSFCIRLVKKSSISIKQSIHVNIINILCCFIYRSFENTRRTLYIQKPTSI